MSVITVTAGHSNKDPGAVNGLFREADIAQEMRNMVALYLRQKDIAVKTDGEGKGNLPLPAAIKLISGSKAAVEFHCNAFPKPTAGGCEALSQPKDRALSQRLCKAVSDVMGIPTRGTDGGWKNEGSGQHSRLGYVRNGGIILELFFISNPAELAVWQDKKWLVAKAVAEVLAEVAK
ncbi:MULTISPECIES: N-acetylmuramoyl-L-alanine amidase [Eikenella]|jgi:probable N-acetylmuramoyl-L-alanine amidase|uniref:N-acetylmuramoyl-L-alanine amidase n=1 Tax=Eikenella glucosivorans TaxID=2766967 RepID=A0ABS0N9S5_9NEIS|nr:MULTISPECIES: N-acetylmuramoyl-L-alanine amidase [Eikenella]MBH5329004.1 N-acetylmuramoyl-L-alanine amidase [Eikenella glucosivorans]